MSADPSVITEFLANLNITKENEKSKKISLDSIVTRIRSGEFKKIVLLTGAGISCSAGIPDFRTPGTGLYDNLQKYNLPTPTSIFELQYFRQNPKPFYTLAKELYPGHYKPTLTHWFMKLLDEQGLVHKIYTQNIDGLEFLTGIPENRVIQAHGGFQRAECIECHAEYSQEYVRQKVMNDEIAYCTSEKCSGDGKSLIKPCITFFGESLPEEFGKSVKSELPQADLLIVMGTSLVVQPFASLVGRVKSHVPRILINNECVGEAEDDEVLMRTNSHYSSLKKALEMTKLDHPMRQHYLNMLKQYRGNGFDFKSPDTRDLFLEGACDTMSLEFARALGGEAMVEKLKKMCEEGTPRTGITTPIEYSSFSSSSSSSTASPFAIGFDFDHTLGMDHHLEIRGIQTYFNRTFGIDTSFLTLTKDELLKQSDGESLYQKKVSIEKEMKNYREVYPEAKDSHEDMLLRIAGMFGVTEQSELKKLCLQNFRDICIELVPTTTPIDGAIELLHYCQEKQIPMAVLTNGWSPLQQKKIQHALCTKKNENESMTFFPPDRILVSDQLGSVKPLPATFNALMSLPGFVEKSRSRVIYFGDNPRGDIGGALEAGLHAVWFDAEHVTYPQGQASPHKIVHTLGELKVYLDELLSQWNKKEEKETEKSKL